MYCDLITSISLICSQNYSTIFTKRLSKLERSKITIESPLNEIIIGLLLGDGHVRQNKKYIFYFDKKRSLLGNSRFMYGQSSLRIQHINYFNHVLELFKPYLSTNFKLKTRSFVDSRNNKSYSSVNFATLSLPCFNYYRNIFYNSDNLKIVPSNIQNLLTPRGLAVKKKNIFFLRLDYG